MATSKSTLRQFILSLPIDGVHRLSAPVGIVARDGSHFMHEIVSVERWGKRGVAHVCDGGGQGWTLSELVEAECARILAAL